MNTTLATIVILLLLVGAGTGSYRMMERDKNRRRKRDFYVNGHLFAYEGFGLWLCRDWQNTSRKFYNIASVRKQKDRRGDVEYVLSLPDPEIQPGTETPLTIREASLSEVISYLEQFRRERRMDEVEAA